ncbi:hypothetical protein GGQ57_001431 [Parabacteroides faecis]|uniref:Uncharacterized protein n=1 Tax=Parabacteroides faecis TaxID=1217282 RepID=A0ABR6KKV6_9BACT|nr:hypothetical protein [Parabacteroides faecis]
MDILIPNQIVKVKILLRSFWDNSLFCMIAGAIPRSLNMLKKEMITVAIATIPNSSGSIRRANIPATTRDTIIPEYLAIAV